MRFTVEITLGNEAMRSGSDVAGALREIAAKVETDQDAGTVRDINGNTVGEFAYRGSP